MADYRRHYDEGPRRHERDWSDRAGDEVRSWFGDDQARQRLHPTMQSPHRGGPGQGRSTPSTMPDVVFISELIDLLQKSYNIDPGAIYANGLSNGGGMAFALSCTLPHRIAAFGAVGAAITLPLDWCPDNRPAPLIAFHGTADRFTPYDGGKVSIAPRPFPSIPEWTARWAERNRCAPVPVDTTIASDVVRREYCDCANDAGVVLYTIEGGGHTWPGGPPFPEWLLGKTTQSVDATREMWAFFSQHRLAH